MFDLPISKDEAFYLLGLLDVFTQEPVRRFSSKQKRKAYDAVRTALQNGTLIKPAICEVCLQACADHAHHEDYTKPLDVVWVCKSCHGTRTSEQTKVIPHRPQHRRYVRDLRMGRSL